MGYSVSYNYLQTNPPFTCLSNVPDTFSTREKLIEGPSNHKTSKRAKKFSLSTRPKLIVFVQASDQRGRLSKEVSRPLEHFHPNIWSDYLFNFEAPAEDIQSEGEQEINYLKMEVREKLLTMASDPKERIIIIDTIEQLGLANRFEEEIEANIKQIYDEYGKHDDIYKHDLQFVSLRFRIFRQHGYPISCDIFEKFKIDDGSVKDSITTDVEGLLNLYQASYLRVHGEKILDELNESTTSKLRSLIGKLTEPMATKVIGALKLPLHRSTTRLYSRYYIDYYESNPSHDQTLLRLAKLDFNLLQSLHIRELHDLSSWWNSLVVSVNIRLTRDRIVETYLWTLGIFYEPQYALARSMYAKVFKIATMTDDIYDSYGLFEELELYTEAVQRWDESYVDKLPKYMKLLYKKLLSTFEELEHDIGDEGRSHLLSYVKEEFKALCRGYFQEAKWMEDKHIPTYEEYMENAGLRSIGYVLLSTTAFLGLGKLANEEAFDWICKMPKLVQAASKISRLMNDIAGHYSKREQQGNNYIPKAVKCYMAQHGVSEEKAIQELHKEVDDAWKDLNEEMFQLKKFPRPLLAVILNEVRDFEVFYRLNGDEYTVVSQNMQDKIRAVLFESIVV